MSRIKLLLLLSFLLFINGITSSSDSSYFGSYDSGSYNSGSYDSGSYDFGSYNSGSSDSSSDESDSYRVPPNPGSSGKPDTNPPETTIPIHITKSPKATSTTTITICGDLNEPCCPSPGDNIFRCNAGRQCKINGINERICIDPIRPITTTKAATRTTSVTEIPIIITTKHTQATTTTQSPNIASTTITTPCGDLNEPCCPSPEENKFKCNEGRECIMYGPNDNDSICIDLILTTTTTTNAATQTHPATERPITTNAAPQSTAVITETPITTKRTEATITTQSPKTTSTTIVTPCGDLNEPCCPDQGENKFKCNAGRECQINGINDGICIDPILITTTTNAATQSTQTPITTKRTETTISPDTTSTAISCGGINERCCNHNEDGGSICNSGLHCKIDIDSTTNIITTICQSCGDIDEPCCVSSISGDLEIIDPCNSNSGLICISDGDNAGFCRHCGGLNEPPCDDGTGNIITTEAPIVCGGINERCCNHNEYGGSICNSGLHCNIDIDSTTNAITTICQSCGGIDEPCCVSSISSNLEIIELCNSNSGLICISDGDNTGFCRRCGGLNEPPCDDGTGNIITTAAPIVCGGVNERCCNHNEGGGNLCDSGLQCKIDIDSTTNDVITICQSCGGIDEPCCISVISNTLETLGSCNNDPALICVSDENNEKFCRANTYVTTSKAPKQCGEINDRCCSHSENGGIHFVCDSGLECKIDIDPISNDVLTICQTCGGIDELCCTPISHRNQVVGSCTAEPGVICIGDGNNEEKYCRKITSEDPVQCGGPNMNCCPPGICPIDEYCCSTLTEGNVQCVPIQNVDTGISELVCQECGELNEACCIGGVCNTEKGLQCVEKQCVNTNNNNEANSYLGNQENDENEMNIDILEHHDEKTVILSISIFCIIGMLIILCLLIGSYCFCKISKRKIEHIKVNESDDNDEKVECQINGNNDDGFHWIIFK